MKFRDRVETIENMSLVEFAEQILDVPIAPLQRRFFESKRTICAHRRSSRWNSLFLGWIYGNKRGIVMDEKKIDNNSEILTFAADGDKVNHPSHYKRGGHECIDLIMDLGFEYSEGSAFKHLFRAGYKIDYPDEPGRDRIEDLRKAARYLSDKADRLEQIANEQTVSEAVAQGAFRTAIMMDEAESTIELGELDPSEWELKGADRGTGESKSVETVRNEEGELISAIEIEPDNESESVGAGQIGDETETTRNQVGETIFVKELLEKDKETSQLPPWSPLMPKGLTLEEAAERSGALGQSLREKTISAFPDDEGLNLDDTPVPPKPKKKGRRKK